MDAPPLPDDPRDWPTDPFALLGVPRSAGEAELKRAYTRLIRKYKPEHAPDEFRRVRAAYEAAVEMSRWYRDAPPVRDTFADFPLAPVDAPASREPEIDAPVRPVAVDPVEAAWADAVAEEWAAAYAALVPLADAHPERADLPLRLYWLLALRPTLDDARTRHDWLALALARGRLSGPAVELYRRELDADPRAALYGPYARLLEQPGVADRNLFAVAGLRLSAAAGEGQWAKVELDLDALAARANDFDEALWLDHLASVAGRAAFHSLSLAKRCAALLAGLKHLELRHSWAFDRIDEQRAGAGVWRDALSVPEPIREAVAVMWAGADCRGPLAAASAWVAADPFAALRKCDQVTGEGTTVLAAFDRLLDARRRAMPDEAEYPPGLIRGLARAHLTGHVRRDYGLMREALLRFLLAERIDPDELATACAEDAAYLVRSIVEHVRADGVLRLVYRAAIG